MTSKREGTGQTAQFMDSGSVRSESIGSGAIQSGHIASGQVGPGHIAPAAITAAKIASGQVARGLIASGTRVWGNEYSMPTGELISGVKAVAISPDGSVVRAERQSGLRLPAIGVTVVGADSGLPCAVVTKGFVPLGASGMFPTDSPGRGLFVGSGGLLTNLSGFLGGSSSGDPFLSGGAVQRIGLAMSGGVFVCPEVTPRSGLILANDQGTF